MKKFLFTLTLLVLLLVSSMLSATTVDFNTTTDLDTYFTQGSPGAISNVSSGGISNTGSVSVPSVNDICRFNNGVMLGVGQSITVSACFYNAVENGYGGVGITTADAFITSSELNPSKGLGIDFHGGAFDYVLNESQTGSAWSTSGILSLNAWYKIEVQITCTATSTYEILFIADRLDDDGNVISGKNSSGLSGISNPSLNGVVVYPYFMVNGNRIPKVDNFVTTVGIAPTTQASALNFASVAGTSITINWTNGNGTSRAVFLKEGTDATINPSDNTTYTASADWNAKGTQLGTSGYYCVYNGTESSVALTNLAGSTTYTVQVLEYNGSAGSELYNTSTALNNPKSQTTDACFAGQYWAARTASSNSAWGSICYGNGLFVAVSLNGTIMTSPDGITWTEQTPPEVGNTWMSVCYGNGLFVAIGQNGDHKVMTSPDGITWTARNQAEDNSWLSVCYGNGLFVAVGRSGTHEVMTSPDGINWTARTAIENNTWKSVTYGNGLFVAVSDDGTHRVMTSPNGVDWTARNQAENNSWTSVCYGNGLFVAVSSFGTHSAMTSPDGITWTASTDVPAASWQSVVYGNGYYIAVSAFGSPSKLMTSPNGDTWTEHNTLESNSWYSIAYGNSTFVAISTDGDHQVMTSDCTDPSPSTQASEVNFTNVEGTSFTINWTNGNGASRAVFVKEGTGAITNPTNSTTYTASADWKAKGTQLGTSGYYCVYNGTGSSVALTNLTGNTTYTVQVFEYNVNAGAEIYKTTTASNNPSSKKSGLCFAGQYWTERIPAVNSSWTSSCYGNGLFVAVASNGKVMTSPDGLNWTEQIPAETDNTWMSVCYGNGLFVAVAQDGTHRVMTSPDGINWTARTPAEDNSWQSICYGNGSFVAVARDGSHEVMTSSDGISWTAQTAAENNYWTSVTYGNNLFVAVSNDGTHRVMTSPDGITWTAQNASGSHSWLSVCYGNGLFVAVSDQAMTSPNGINWTERTASAAGFWSSVAYGNGLFTSVSLMTPPAVITSPNGINWTVRTTPDYNNWTTVSYGDGTFVALSSTGKVMSSDCSDPTLTTQALEVNFTNVEGTSLTINWTNGNGSKRVVFVKEGTGSITNPTNATTYWASNDWNVQGTELGTSGYHCVYNGTGNSVALTNLNGNTTYTVQVFEYNGNAGLEYYLTTTATNNPNYRTTDECFAGQLWVPRSGMNSFTKIVYGNGIFLAASSGGYCATSPDGITWTPQSISPYSSYFSALGYGNGLFIALSYLGNQLLTSTNDGVTWVNRTMPLSTNWTSIAYGNGTYVAICPGGAMTSFDGINLDYPHCRRR